MRCDAHLPAWNVDCQNALEPCCPCRAIRSDFIPTVLAAAAMATAYACVSPEATAADVATAVVLSVGYILLYILALDGCNQATGAGVRLPRFCVLAYSYSVWSVCSRKQARL